MYYKLDIKIIISYQNKYWPIIYIWVLKIKFEIYAKVYSISVTLN